MAYSGKYRIKNPKKYKADPAQCIYRSLLERRFMRFCDEHPSVIAWSYENIIIPYRCATDGRMHRYFCDFWVRRYDASGEIKNTLVEIKPDPETRPPERKPRKSKRRFLTECATYAKNTSKWEYAKAWAEARGMDFRVITDKDLKGMSL